jgi:diaminopimelate dehydrogenase
LFIRPMWKERMKRRRVAIVGLGKLGKACAYALQLDEGLVLAGIVRRPERLKEKLPVAFGNIPVVAHVSELQAIDAALVCVPAEQVAGMAHDLMQRKIPIVECAVFPGEAWRHHKDELDRIATRYRVPVIVGAGWDPGAMSLLRSLFALLIPKGATEVTHRPGVTLRHTTLAGTVAGVKGALATELRTAARGRQRYVYVELEDGTDYSQVEDAIRNDPLFLGEETIIFQVDSVAALEEEGHGVVLERHGSTGETGHQSILLEARFAESALSAQIMLAGARALATCDPGAHSLFDLSPNLLWGEWRTQAERDWI